MAWFLASHQLIAAMTDMLVVRMQRLIESKVNLDLSPKAEVHTNLLHSLSTSIFTVGQRANLFYSSMVQLLPNFEAMLSNRFNLTSFHLLMARLMLQYALLVMIVLLITVLTRSTTRIPA
jgi:hypothetical protein